MMSQPAEFSQESVRQFMLAAGGRVTNHDLVKTFRRWLTDPVEKEVARTRFKDYVNTLATIKQENGEKYLILKKKFYPDYIDNRGGYQKPPSAYRDPPAVPQNYNDPPGYQQQRSQPGYNNSSSPSLLDEVMAGFAPIATPTRSTGRQLPPIPQQQPPLHHQSQPTYHQSQPLHQPSQHTLGLPTGPHSLGLPQPPDNHRQFHRQSSVDYITRSDLPTNYNQLSQPTRTDPPYNQLSPTRTDPSYNHPAAYNQQPPPPTRTDPSYNPAGFNPHINHNRGSISSLASYGSVGSSYQSSPRASYATGSPRNSYTNNQYNSRLPDYQQQQTHSSRQTDQTYPTTHLPEPINNYHKLPEHHYQTKPPELAYHKKLPEPPSSYQPGRAVPPPYRAPPPEPVSSHRMPPADLGLPPAPRQFSDSSSHSSSLISSPPPPPKRGSPDSNPPPPLPSRPPPIKQQSQPTPLLPLDPPTPIQPSPTDSGFQTAPEDKSPDSPGRPRLSKSYGNLHHLEDEQDNKENLAASRNNSVSLDQLEPQDPISVKERTKTFNRLASETDLVTNNGFKHLSKSAVKRRNSRAVDFTGRRGSCRDDESHDSSSITTIDPTIKSWMVHTAKGDYQTAAKMLNEEPKLARHKDFTNGYTALHWAAKHNNLDMVKLLAGTYQAHVDARSHGGYTPLHIAAQSGHQEVFDLLVQAYRADANLRDYAGKKPRQCMVGRDTATVGLNLSLSSDTLKQLKDGRKNRTSRREKNPGILRFGSLSVKVKKTTEAFNNYFNSSGESSKKLSSNDISGPMSLTDTDKMPPPKFNAPIKKRKSKRTGDFGRTKSAPVTPTNCSPVKEVIHEEDAVDGRAGSDSDSEYGFGDTWA